MNAPFWVEHQVITFWWVCCVVHPPESNKELFNSQRCIHDKWLLKKPTNNHFTIFLSSQWWFFFENREYISSKDYLLHGKHLLSSIQIKRTSCYSTTTCIGRYVIVSVSCKEYRVFNKYFVDNLCTFI